MRPTEVLRYLSDFGTMNMHRLFHACVYEFLTMVTEGVVHGVQSFGVTQRHKVSYFTHALPIHCMNFLLW